MAFKIFTVPIHHTELAESELNAFLRSRTVVSVERHLIDHGSNSCWSFCVDYLDPAAGGGKAARPTGQRSKVDYREVLSDEDFAVFAKLRDLRKQVAQAGGVPVYTVFNNEQLAKMVQNKVKNKADLEAIIGVGDGRVEKYGDRFLEFLSQQGKGDRETEG